mgnify:CR=1 FL=1
MSQGKQSFLGGAALLTVTMLITKAIGPCIRSPWETCWTSRA